MFLKNAWYAAMWCKDLPAGEPVAKTFLDEPVVLFRTEAGTPAALEDRCCHRAAPLSRGLCLGETIQCGYHGLQFDITGACVHIPGQSNIPPGAEVRRYPVCERHGVLWIWMGMADKADESTIPDYYWLDDPGWVAATGTIPMQGNYQLLVDNLLDFTHVTYLHKNTISSDPSEATVPIKVERGDDSVSVSRWILDLDAPPLFAKAGGFNGKVDRWQTTTWKAPSTLAFDVGCATAGTGAQQGDRSHGISIWSMHLITPETETSTHYNWGYVRNFALDDPAMTQLLHDGAEATFLEDVEMIEAQQKNLDGGAVDGLIDINADNPPIQMRRIMKDLIAAESAATA
jgi:phenylpropionate dioxygenase-like ring-hydroxylating dioxygenase large terminal subunit